MPNVCYSHEKHGIDALGKGGQKNTVIKRLPPDLRSQLRITSGGKQLIRI